jgi:hypothetical protein
MSRSAGWQGRWGGRFVFERFSVVAFGPPVWSLATILWPNVALKLAKHGDVLMVMLVDRVVRK